MNDLEDALEPLLSQDNFATLALVSTGEDLREWTYYAKAEDEFETRFDYALAGASVFPIEIHVAHDPKWGTYEQYNAGIMESSLFAKYFPHLAKNRCLIAKSNSGASSHPSIVQPIATRRDSPFPPSHKSSLSDSLRPSAFRSKHTKFCT